ncbi:MAG: O-antigen ligase family protein [Chitinophagaceae bacterium]
MITLNIVAFIHAGLPAHQVFSYDFTGIAFVKPLKEMHPVYLGSYCLFACVLLWSKLLLPKGLKICFTCILLAGIVFLNSRSIYFLSILILLISLFSVLSIKRAILLLVAAIVFFFLIHPVIKSTYVYNKMVYGTFWELRENVAKKNINKDVLADSRMSRWLISIDLIKEKPVFGHGTGESRDLLKQRYQERGMKASYVQAYDSHNQYLGYALDYGLLGLLFLCGFFFLNIRAAVLNKDLNMFLLIFMLGWVCLFENYLIRNMGINFVSLFLLIFHLKHNE